MEYIGFTEKYYTLWDVTTKGEYTYYQYKQNLSMQFEKAKAKRPNALIDLSLRGHKSFKVKNTIPTDCFLFGQYKNEPYFDHLDDVNYLVWYYNRLDAETFKNPLTKYIENSGYSIINGKAYESKLVNAFPKFQAKVENNEVFRFNAQKNLSLSYNENEEEIAVMNIPFCHFTFPNFEKKTYNDVNYAIPSINGKGYFIKGKRVVIDEYTATKADDITYNIVVNKFHIEY